MSRPQNIEEPLEANTLSQPVTTRKTVDIDTSTSFARWVGGTGLPNVAQNLTRQSISYGTTSLSQEAEVTVTESFALEPFVPPVVVPHRPWRVRTRFIALQEWEGTVISMREDHFLARLIDPSRKTPDIEAEFPFDEIPEGDHDLLAVGAIFHWRIGYADQSDGQRSRVSIIRFRRMPRWEEEDIRSAEREADRLRRLLGGK